MNTEEVFRTTERIDEEPMVYLKSCIVKVTVLKLSREHVHTTDLEWGSSHKSHWNFAIPAPYN
jgi:hypothetical protein